MRKLSSLRYLVPAALMACWQYFSGIPDPEYLSALGETDSARQTLSSIAGLASPRVLNLVHMPFFAALAASLAWAAESHSFRLGVRITVSLVVVSLFALLNELSQAWVPGRFASVGDALWDLLGAAAGCWLYGWLRVRRPRGT
jgi:hypothetical protein